MAEKNCEKCGRSIPAENLFCPYCGSKQTSVKSCVKCHRQIKGEALYCPYCGRKQEQVRVCSKCGTVINKNAKFCSSCGSDENPESERSTKCVYKEDKLLRYYASKDTGNVGIGDLYDIQDYYYSGIAEESMENYKDAFENYKKAYEMHGYTGGLKYAGFLWNGTGCEADRKLALEVYTDIAEKQNVKAMVWLGIVYMNGMNVAQDKDLAMRWFAEAEKIDESELVIHPYSNGNMDPAVLYSMGLFNNGKTSEAGILLRKRLEVAFSMDACIKGLKSFVKGLLGGSQRFYDSDHDFARFLEDWINNKGADHAAGEVVRISEAVNVAKCYKEGSRYLNGDGVVQNPLKAIKWFIRGGQSGHALCQYYAGYIYACGLLGTPDYEKCKYWYTKAARNGIKEAAEYLNNYRDFFRDIDCSNIVEPPVTEAEIYRIDYYRDQILEAADKFGYAITEGHQEYCFSPKIPLQNLNNAVAQYAHGISPGNILFMYDASFDKNGKKGFVFTDKEVVSSNGVRVSFDNIAELVGSMDSDDVYFYVIAMPTKQIIYKAYDKSTMEKIINLMNEMVFQGKNLSKK